MQIIKDVYTEYYSGSVVITPPPTNIEFVAGSAGGGVDRTRYTISDKATAVSVFKSGDLLDALIERLDAGSSMIYAMRIVSDNGAQASIELKDVEDAPVIKLEGVEPGVWWNGVFVAVTVDELTVTVTITSPDDDVFDFDGETTQELVDAINAGQSLVVATKVIDSLPVTMDPTHLSGGHDGADLSIVDFTAAFTTEKPGAIALSEKDTDVAWVHFIGAADFPGDDGQGNPIEDPWDPANSIAKAFSGVMALWTAILTSCENMVNDNLGERFAILDFPRFKAVDLYNPTAIELQDYVTRSIAAIAEMANQNAVFFLGEGKFNSADGEVYTNRLTSAVSGQMAAVALQKSLLGESPVNIISLVPEFLLGHQAELVVADINHLRVEPGIGKIIALSNVACPTGSTYNRIEKLRAVYSAGKQVRIAAFPHLGRPNDAAGEGIQLLEADLKKPLDLMVYKRQIDTYELTVECTPEMRTLGEANVILSVNSMKAFEIILTKVYLD